MLPVPAPPPPCDPVFVLQYPVPLKEGREEGCARCLDVVYATSCYHVPLLPPPQLWPDGRRPRILPSPLLGPHGHLERFSVWSHVVGGLLFALYAVVRVAVADTTSTSGALATAVAATTAATFFSSSLYHATGPDREISTMTRILDYTGIYAALVMTALADLAVATRAFEGVPLQSVLDVPAAALMASGFFLWRRLRVPKDDTWERSNNGLPDVLDTGQPLHCSIGAGLIGFGHEDQHHSPLRLGTSVILSGAYFVLIPEATATLGADVAAVAVGLQGAGFLILGAALLVDRVLKWPNKALAKGEAQCLVCQDCGCVAHSHGIWHVAAVLSAVLTAVGREYALGMS